MTPLTTSRLVATFSPVRSSAGQAGAPVHRTEEGPPYIVVGTMPGSGSSVIRLCMRSNCRFCPTFVARGCGEHPPREPYTGISCTRSQHPVSRETSANCGEAVARYGARARQLYPRHHALAGKPVTPQSKSVAVQPGIPGCTRYSGPPRGALASVDDRHMSASDVFSFGNALLLRQCTF